MAFLVIFWKSCGATCVSVPNPNSGEIVPCPRVISRRILLCYSARLLGSL